MVLFFFLNTDHTLQHQSDCQRSTLFSILGQPWKEEEISPLTLHLDFKPVYLTQPASSSLGPELGTEMLHLSTPCSFPKLSVSLRPKKRQRRLRTICFPYCRGQLTMEPAESHQLRPRGLPGQQPFQNSWDQPGTQEPQQPGTASCPCLFWHLAHCQFIKLFLEKSKQLAKLIL